MASVGYRLGIDFGTSTTVAVFAARDRPAVPLLFESSPLLPSAVATAADGSLLTGGDAERAAVASPASFEANPKRRIDDGVVWLGEREIAVPDLIAAVFARVLDEARRVAGGMPGEVVLTHPVAWGRGRVDVLVDAAARAGLAEVRLVAEPVGAAAYLTTVLGRRIRVGRCLIVYDLGAGTFDVSVVRRTAGGFEVVASGGLDDVGGLDLDAVVVGHTRRFAASSAAWSRLDWPRTSADQQARHQLWRGARAAKEQLSRHAVAPLHVPLAGADLHLTREEFEKSARDPLARTVERTVDVLRGSGVAPEEVAGLFLVGGASRVPLVATLLHRALRIAPIATEVPELVVAEGSLQALAAPRIEPAVVSTVEPSVVPSIDPPREEPVGEEPGVESVPARVAPAAAGALGRFVARGRQVRVWVVRSGGAVGIAALAVAVAAHAAESIEVDLVATGVGFVALVLGVLVAGAGGRRSWWALVPLALLLLARPMLSDSGDGTNPFADVVDRVYRWRRLEVSPVDAVAALLAFGAGVVCARRRWLPGWRRRLPLAAGVAAVANVLAYGLERWQHFGGRLALVPPLTGWLAVAASVGLGLALITVPRRLVAGPGAEPEPPAKPLGRHLRSLRGQAAFIVALVVSTVAVATSIEATPAYASRVIDTGEAVAEVVYSPDGKVVATMTTRAPWIGPYRVRLWDAQTGRLVATLDDEQSDSEIDVVFDPTGDTVYTNNVDSGLRRWRTATGEPVATLTDLFAYAFALSPDGTTIAASRGDRITLLDAATGTAIRDLVQAEAGEYRQVAFSPDGKILAVGEDGDLLLVDVAAGREIARLAPAHPDKVLPAIHDIAFDDSGTRIVTTGTGWPVRVWRVSVDPPRMPVPMITPVPALGWIEAAFSPDGQHIAVPGYADRRVYLWPMSGGTPTMFRGHGDHTTTVAFAPDGRTLASGGRDGTVRLWRLPSG